MIAIVDDDPLVRRAVERVLRASGYMVAVFESGASPVKHIVANHGSPSIARTNHFSKARAFLDPQMH